MKTINKIIGIGIIALIAIVSVGAVSADETLENVGAHLTPTVAPHTYEKGILTIPINDHVDDLPNVGAWNYVPCPEPTLNAWTPEHPEPTIDLNGHGNTISTQDVTGYFHSGDFPKSFNVDDWNGYTAGEWTPEHSEPSSVWLVGSAQDTTSMEFGDI